MTSDNIFNKNNICILTNTPCKIVYGGINRCTCNVCNMPLIYREGILNGKYEYQLNLEDVWTWKEYLVYGSIFGSLIVGLIAVVVMCL